MSSIEVVIFDVDGTIANTYDHILHVYESVLPVHGIYVERDDIRKAMGSTLVDCYRQLAPNVDNDLIVQRHREVQQSPEVFSLIVAYSGIKNVLNALKNSKIKNVIFTNRSNRSLGGILDQVGLADDFEMSLTCDDVTNPKPDPEGILRIAHDLNVAPSQMIMVGDTPTDIMAGKNAGCAATLALTHGFGTKDELIVVKPDLIADSFFDVEDYLQDSGVIYGS